MAETPPPEFIRFVQAELARLLNGPEILEIGGGTATYIRWPTARYTVLDVSEEVLAKCTYADEIVLADAHCFDPGSKRYDLVIFWNVLEHLADPGKALARAADAVRVGGLLIARGPELRSLKALITRLTPHRFHVAFYRRVLGFQDAGENDSAPFPVEHSSGASRNAIMALLTSRNFGIEFDQRYVGDQLRLLRSYSRTAYWTYELVSAALRLLTRGRWGAPTTDFVLVLRKQG